MINVFSTSKNCFWLKYESSIHNIYNVFLQYIYFEINFEVHDSCKQKCQWILMWEDNSWWIFFTWGSVIMDYGLIFWPETMISSLHRMLIGGLGSCGLLVDYCDVFISCGLSFWRHPFTAEDPLGSLGRDLHVSWHKRTWEHFLARCELRNNKYKSLQFPK